MTNTLVDLAEKLSLFSEHRSPKTIAQLNDYEIKVVKIQGEFVWHTHQDTDELFLVLAGEPTIRLRDRDVVLGPGQLFVVARGVEQCPVAQQEVHAVLIEPAGTANTGDAGGSLTATREVIWRCLDPFMAVVRQPTSRGGHHRPHQRRPLVSRLAAGRPNRSGRILASMCD